MAIHRGFTRWGVVYRADVCRDDWGNIVEKVRDGYRLKLQRPALKSYRAAEAAIGREIVLTGSWRACSTQAALYKQDPNRFAHPNSTLHTQGLAIDVSTAQPDQARIREVLTRRGWHQSRPVDEPWHYSFHWTA